MSENWCLASLGALAYESRSHYASHVPGNLIDADEVTYWEDLGTPVVGGAISFDLGSPRLISSIRLNQSVTATKCATAVDVKVSPDGVNYSLVANYSISTGDTSWNIEPTAARWWKIEPTTGGSGRWAIYTAELIGVDSPVPVVTDIAAWIQWLFDNGYQDAADKLEELDPGWTFSPVETFLLAGIATCVSLCAQVLAASGSGEVDFTEVLTAIGAVGEGSLHSEHSTIMTLVGNLHTLVDDEIVQPTGHLTTAETNIEQAITAAFVSHETSLGAGTGLGTGKLDAVVNAIGTPGQVDLSEVTDALTSVQGKLGEYGEGETVHSMLGGIAGDASAAHVAGDNVTTIVGDLHTDLATVDGVVDQILDAVGNLEIPAGGSDGRYPGPSGATLSTPVAFSGPTLIEATMDGVLLDLEEMAPSTGYHTHSGYTNWLHAGYLCFLAQGGYADELQYLNMSTAAYSPKRISAPKGVLIYPRAGTSGTITPWTLNA